jgi:hypothetical protein
VEGAGVEMTVHIAIPRYEYERLSSLVRRVVRCDSLKRARLPMWREMLKSVGDELARALEVEAER